MEIFIVYHIYILALYLIYLYAIKKEKVCFVVDAAWRAAMQQAPSIKPMYDECNDIPLRPLQGIIRSTYFYHTFALRIAVCLKFHHLVEFETDTCPRNLTILPV